VRVEVWVTGTHRGDALAVWVPPAGVSGRLVEVGGADGLGGPDTDADPDALGEPDGLGGPDVDADGDAVVPPSTSSVSGGDVESV
jgi:hypothetical protein